MSTIYRIYCGLDTNGHDIDAKSIVNSLAAECFPHGHTVIEANGRWMGEVGVIDEPTLIIEYITENPKVDEKHVTRFAGLYKIKAYQESVLINRINADSFFV